MPREASLKLASPEDTENDENDEDDDEEGASVASSKPSVSLTPERYAELEEAEQFLLSLTADGFGKRSSSYNYPMKGRGGMGVRNGITVAKGGAATVSFFPVELGDEVMLITDGGRMITNRGGEYFFCGA